jgi:ATP-binding cassette subfamily F protein 3
VIATPALAIHPLAGTVAIHAMLTVSQVSKSFAGRVEAGAGSNAPGYKPGLREQKAQKRAEAEVRKMLAKQQREREQSVRELEMHIAALEGQQKELALELENPAVYEAGGRAVAINRELSAVSDELERLTTEWEKATAEVVPA